MAPVLGGGVSTPIPGECWRTKASFYDRWGTSYHRRVIAVTDRGEVRGSGDDAAGLGPLTLTVSAWCRYYERCNEHDARTDVLETAPPPRSWSR